MYMFFSTGEDIESGPVPCFFLSLFLETWPLYDLHIVNVL